MPLRPQPHERGAHYAVHARELENMLARAEEGGAFADLPSDEEGTWAWKHRANQMLPSEFYALRWPASFGLAARWSVSWHKEK